MTPTPEMHAVALPAGDVTMSGELGVPAEAIGLVIFAHGSGSSRFSPRNTAVAWTLRSRNIATLLFDLLTAEEDVDYVRRFDIALLTRRLVAAATWAQEQALTAALPIGFFGASTGAAAALSAAAEMGDTVKAVVSRGGRPDLAMAALPRVMAPTLLIVGGNDPDVLDLNREAYAALTGVKRLTIVPGATHLFEEPGALEQVASLALGWFNSYLRGATT
jgi:putative phosphoribosyl transferase